MPAAPLVQFGKAPSQQWTVLWFMDIRIRTLTHFKCTTVDGSTPAFLANSPGQAPVAVWE